MKNNSYPATLDIKYSSKLDRVSSVFRLIWSIPILVILSLLSGSDSTSVNDSSNQSYNIESSGIAVGLPVAIALMIVFRQKYPKWWFDFNLELTRFSTRVMAYLFLLTDKYPSTDEKQVVDLNVEYPDVQKDLDRWMPLVKWLLAFPHYIVLAILYIGVFLVSIAAWISILFSGTYPRSLFDYVVGVMRWSLRVQAYAFMLTTDKYPPFSLD